MDFIFPWILGIASHPNWLSYFSEGWLNQPNHLSRPVAPGVDRIKDFFCTGLVSIEEMVVFFDDPTDPIWNPWTFINEAEDSLITPHHPQLRDGFIVMLLKNSNLLLWFMIVYVHVNILWVEWYRVKWSSWDGFRKDYDVSLSIIPNLGPHLVEIDASLPKKRITIEKKWGVMLWYQLPSPKHDKSKTSSPTRATCIFRLVISCTWQSYCLNFIRGSCHHVQVPTFVLNLSDLRADSTGYFSMPLIFHGFSPDFRPNIFRRFSVVYLASFLAPWWRWPEGSCGCRLPVGILWTRWVLGMMDR